MNQRHEAHSGHQHPRGEAPKPYWKRAHRDWKTWVAVLAMLVGICVYILTVDETLRPPANAPSPVPARP